jgi:septum formation protein
MVLPQFVLASASPARRRLLQAVGINPIVRPSDVDESLVQDPDPKTLVQTLALRKAEAVADQLAKDESRGGATLPLLVMGCDSVLAIHGEIHGKPNSPEEAIARWQQMRGQVGELLTGHVLIEMREEGGLGIGDRGSGGNPKSKIQNLKSKTLVRCQITQVYFADVSDRQIEAYVATGEPLNCAGCFALEGKGGLFVEKLEGCHSNVIGLSLPLLRQMLADMEYDIADFW